MQYNLIMSECCCVLSADWLHHVQLYAQITVADQDLTLGGRGRVDFFNGGG